MSVLYLLASVLIWGLLHSWLASLPVKERFRVWLGAGAMRYYRLAYNLFSALSFLPLLALLSALPDRPLYAIPMPWVILTGAGQLAAVALLAAGLWQTGALDFLGLRALWDAAPRPDRLVTTGLYRCVRHPLYTAGLLFIWLSPVMTMNLLTLYAAFTVYIIVGALFEERKLLREFGSAYADYRARTPMLIPWPRGNKSPSRASFH